MMIFFWPTFKTNNLSDWIWSGKLLTPKIAHVLDSQVGLVKIERDTAKVKFA